MKSGPLWAISSLFNPCRYRSRAANFREFRRRLDVPLLAVELSFDGTFELGDEDADVVVRVHGGDVMWQKERLLNLGRMRLPAECEAIAVLDADVVFTRAGWSEAAFASLRSTPVAQLFSQVHYLARGATVEEAPGRGVEGSQFGYAWAAATGELAAQAFNPGIHGRGALSPGFAWAYRRDLVDRHGFYDGSIVGGGDTKMSHAAWGMFDAVAARHDLADRRLDHYLAWAKPWFADVHGDVACIEGELLHLAHGSIADRRSRERHRILAAHGFDPFVDIAGHASGSWRWASDKPALHGEVADYFAARREDG